MNSDQVRRAHKVLNRVLDTIHTRTGARFVIDSLGENCTKYENRPDRWYLYARVRLVGTTFMLTYWYSENERWRRGRG